MLAGKHLAGTAKAGLDLIKNQQRPVSGADLPDTGEVACLRYDDPALSLDRLYNKGSAALVAQLCLQRIEVTERDTVAVRHERLKGLLVFFTAGNRQRAQRFTVERAFTVNKSCPAGGGARQFKGSFDRLGAAVAEERAAQVTGGGQSQVFGQGCRQGAEGGLEQVGHFLDLVDGVDNFRVVVAQVERPVGA
ncbi:hypothetical protein Psfp_02667 [Pelotomaculum sp. FP]|nr:hypothetical protein Psfp_02667 [Pelotomaculum sp. FP]